jgi:tRNA threonylcarbamoyladenosine biosynthesis protein TsaE
MQSDVMDHTKVIFREVTVNGLPEVARRIVELMDNCRVAIFQGEMGSGKTTLIKAIGGVLNVQDTMSSPTFSIVNEYRTSGGGVIYHFDLYRIKSEAEARDIGTEEYLYSGKYCFIEWAEKIQSLLPNQYAVIAIETTDASHRTIEFSIHGREEKDRV